MSFKREGDDLSLLNKLKHQRVSDLLGAHIPEEEAKLLSNGRLTCLVCQYRPIFDTTQMLAKHRAGKKHLIELSRYLRKKRDLELEILKRKQLNDLKEAENPAPLGNVDCQTASGQRRKVIDIPSVGVRPKVLGSSQSPSSQVRHYLKSLPSKQGLVKSIERQKESYMDAPVKREVEPIIKSQEKELKSALLTTVNKEEFHRNLSGFIKDKFGNWIKDPNAEFDSDEEVEDSK